MNSYNDMSIGDAVFWIIVIIALAGVLAVGFIAIAKMIEQRQTPATTYAQNDFNYRNLLVQACLKDEQYTREECIILASGKQ